jgi:hypothetical protein
MGLVVEVYGGGTSLPAACWPAVLTSCKTPIISLMCSSL